MPIPPSFRARLPASLRRRLTLRTAFALFLGVAAAYGFIELTEEVLEGETGPFDRAVTGFVQGIDAPALDEIMRVITQLGSFWALGGVVLLVAGWAFYRGRRWVGGMVLGVSLSAVALNALLKLLFQRPRPDLFARITAPESYSFPSGHAMSSCAIYGVVALALGALLPRLRGWIYGVTGALVLLIGTSRIYLGVHWATDVAAGFAAGGILLAAAQLGPVDWSEAKGDAEIEREA